jgi:hypothetical protein
MKFRVYFSAKDFSKIQLVCKDFVNMVPRVFYWLRIDFAPMCEPRLGYEEQNHINSHRVKMASVAMIHFSLDPGKLFCFLAGKYTGHY